MITIPIIFKAVCAHALKALALPRAGHSGEIALAGSRRLRSTVAAAPVLFTHALVTEIKIGRIISPKSNSWCQTVKQSDEQRKCMLWVRTMPFRRDALMASFHCNSVASRPTKVAIKAHHTQVLCTSGYLSFRPIEKYYVFVTSAHEQHTEPLENVHALEGLVCRLRVAPASSPAAPASRVRRRLRSTLAAAPGLRAHALVTNH